jgi:hypothetical protein
MFASDARRAAVRKAEIGDCLPFNGSTISCRISLVVNWPSELMTAAAALHYLCSSLNDRMRIAVFLTAVADSFTCSSAMLLAPPDGRCSSCSRSRQLKSTEPGSSWPATHPLTRGPRASKVADLRVISMQNVFTQRRTATAAAAAAAAGAAWRRQRERVNATYLDAGPMVRAFIGRGADAATAHFVPCRRLVSRSRSSLLSVAVPSQSGRSPTQKRLARPCFRFGELRRGCLPRCQSEYEAERQ